MEWDSFHETYNGAVAQRLNRDGAMSALADFFRECTDEELMADLLPDERRTDMDDAQYFSPDRMLNLNAIRDAAHALFTSEYASLADARGCHLPTAREGTTLEQWTPRQADSIMLPFAWWLIGRIQQAWTVPVGLVFHHAGITQEADQRAALTLLFLGISGSGAHLREEEVYSEGLARAEEILHQEFDDAPCYVEMSVLYELAESILGPSPDSEVNE